MELYISPKQYVTGYDNILELGKYLKQYGENVLFLIDNNLLDKFGDKINDIKKEYQLNIDFDIFTGECSYDEIERVKENIINKKINIVVGFGGGKIIDTAKGASFLAKIPVATVPTIAATCAAWSSHSAVYTSNGISYEYFSIYKNPELLFIDKKIILEAPIRYIKSGILDTLAKWIETDAYTNQIKNRDITLETAIFLAKKSYDDIFKYGKKAIEDIKKGEYTDIVDKIVEHIFLTAGLVGGIGGAACRAVASHAVNNGFTVLTSRYKNSLHGEVVAFGNIVQLILDNKDEDEIKKLIKLYKEIEAPCGLEELGYGNLTEDELEKIVNKSLYKGDTIWNLPYVVSYDMLYNSIKKADLLCKSI